MSAPMKVGALARQTGLSVRTLHHYDDIGLLQPSQRTEAGHRLYVPADISRLQQIQSLRATGIPLGDIQAMLDGDGLSPQRVIAMHLDRLQAQIAMQENLVRRLEQLTRHLNSAAPISVDALCRIIEEMGTMDKYFTPEQQAELSARAASMSAGRMEQVGAEWAEIIPAVRAHMARKTAPSDPDVQALAVRWRALVDEFTGGNHAIAGNVREMYKQEGPAIAERLPNTPDPEMFAYMGSVFKALPGGGPG